MNFKNNNNKTNTTTTDNNNKSNNLVVTTDIFSNIDTNPIAFARIEVGRVQSFPEVALLKQYIQRQLHELFNRGSQILQQLCHDVEQHREYRIRERNSFQRQNIKVNNSKRNNK